MSTTIVNVKAPRVSNMHSPRTGNPVANQYIIDMNQQEIFQSYSTIIAVKRYGKDPSIVLDADSWDYSVTTLKYLKEFLSDRGYHGLSKKDIQGKIDSGEFATGDLNARAR